MAKMTNAQGIRLYESIRSHMGQAEADEFAAALPLSQSADYLKKFDWARRSMEYITEKYSDDEVRALRMDCHCNINHGEAERLRRLYNESGSAESFCRNFTETGGGAFSLWYIADEAAIYMSYPTCYCSCVKRVPETLSPAWCLCTLGYTKEMFSVITGGDVNVELIESIKRGDDRCVMKITGAERCIS